MQCWATRRTLQRRDSGRLYDEEPFLLSMGQHQGQQWIPYAYRMAYDTSTNRTSTIISVTVNNIVNTNSITTVNQVTSSTSLNSVNNTLNKTLIFIIPTTGLNFGSAVGWAPGWLGIDVTYGRLVHRGSKEATLMFYLVPYGSSVENTRPIRA